MTSAEWGVGGTERGREMQEVCGQTVYILRTNRREGAKKSQNVMNVIYVSPLIARSVGMKKEEKRQETGTE